MRYLLLCLLLFPFFGMAQDYVDLLKVGYGQTFNNNFDGTEYDTEIISFEVDFTFPVVLNKKNALITGAAFSRNHLELFPTDPLALFQEGTEWSQYRNLYSTILKLGLATTFNEKWSSTFVLLPKIASDYQNISNDDFYIGGFAMLKLQKRESLIYRFGLYGSTEAFGFFTTPIVGWYYLSPGKKFEMDMSLPISADINYTEGLFTYGVDYFGIGRSFNLTEENTNEYVDVSSLEFAGYIQCNTWSKSVLLRAKIGYASSDYEVYTQGDKIGLGLSAFSFGDDRTQLNPTISGGLFLKFEAIYRFHISSDEKDANH